MTDYINGGFIIMIIFFSHSKRMPSSHNRKHRQSNYQYAPAVITIDDVLEYFITRKESDCTQAQDWKSFKSGIINCSRKVKLPENICDTIR